MSVHQQGATAETVPKTPSSRREALYERLRQRSLSASPTKAASSDVKGGKLTRDQLLKMGQDELRRSCFWAASVVSQKAFGCQIFSTPVLGSTASSSVRKRRTLHMSEVIPAIVKSSPVPISSAEAVDSLTIGGEEWIEMPALSAGVAESSPSKNPAVLIDSATALVSRSPRRVKRDTGGLREVREIIRRELELHE
ncbi:hypothetical protein B0H13DRAFT_1851147 [Mycena leptocephala]|nr:hypothetical protein B0H13DRAFT_1851147 [Mycena leptocephala]